MNYFIMKDSKNLCQQINKNLKIFLKLIRNKIKKIN